MGTEFARAKSVGVGSFQRNEPQSRSGATCRGTPRRETKIYTCNEKERHEGIVALLPLVHRVAIRMRSRLPSYIETEELVSAGVLGLVDAIRKFDSRRRVKLESYASHRIRGAILDSLRSLDTASRDVRNKGKRAERVYRELESRLGTTPGADAVAHGLGISLKKWYRMAREIHLAGADGYFHAHSPRHVDCSEDLIAAENSKDQFRLCYLREQRELVARALARLPERQRVIFNLYYTRELTMKQIGKVLKIDESRVSQLHSAGLVHLRASVMEWIRPASVKVPLSYPPPFIASHELGAPVLAA